MRGVSRSGRTCRSRRRDEGSERGARASPQEPVGDLLLSRPAVLGNRASTYNRRSFTKSRHKRLAESLRWLDDPYLLSYDPAPEIAALYGHDGLLVQEIELLYSGRATGGIPKLVITNLPELPLDAGDSSPRRTDLPVTAFLEKRVPASFKGRYGPLESAEI
jgi:hypothetical protein